MSIITIEGFKVYVNGKKSIIINSDCIDECMHIYQKHHLDGVAITYSHDYKLSDINFLARYPEISHLSFSEEIKDISAIYALKSLKSLTLTGKNRKVDFSYFPLLTDLIADWSSQFSNMDKCERLTQLTFYGYNPKTKDCSIISNVPWIKSLEITNSSITNMNGLEKCYQLEEISFNYCSKLEKICCLEGSKHILNSLSFEHCKSIVNHDYVKKLDQLKLLTYKYSGAIKSIKFIKKISSLERFIFFGTDVIDGDLIPCISLIDAGFTNKKHFSHTMEQINRLQKERSITPFTR